MSRSAYFLCLTGLLCWACSSDEEAPPLDLARPVTTSVLQFAAPKPTQLIPGIVTPYRQTEIAFEVSGRIQRLVDIGEELIGEQFSADGAVVREGGVIAELDPEPFERARTQAEQRLVAARLELQAQVVQLESVLEAKLASATAFAKAAELNTQSARDDVEATESAMRLAETTLERNRDLLPTGAVSDIVVRQSETDLQTQVSRLAQTRTQVTTRERDHDSAIAAIAEVEGNKALQRAKNLAAEANIAGLIELVADAESDLDNCVLRAPFSGRVTAHRAGEGGVVQAGAAVITLTMMSPIEVEITVSASEDRQLVVGTDAIVYPMNGNEVDLEAGIQTTLTEKPGIADASTRTFRLALLTPNKRRVVRTGFAGTPTAQYLVPLIENPFDLPGEPKLYTLADAVDITDGKTTVLRVLNLARGQRTGSQLTGKLMAERVTVETGDHSMKVASFRLVELTSWGNLTRNDLLVPLPTPEHETGFVVTDNRWQLRPGDLVRVAVERQSLPSGFYVPVQAIREVNGVTSVFVVGAENTVKGVIVEPLDSVANLRRVISTELSAGDAIVIKGAHFLQDGDKVILSVASSGAGI